MGSSQNSAVWSKCAYLYIFNRQSILNIIFLIVITYCLSLRVISLIIFIITHIHKITCLLLVPWLVSSPPGLCICKAFGLVTSTSCVFLQYQIRVSQERTVNYDKKKGSPKNWYKAKIGLRANGRGRGTCREFNLHPVYRWKYVALAPSLAPERNRVLARRLCRGKDFRSSKRWLSLGFSPSILLCNKTCHIFSARFSFEMRNEKIQNQK